MLLALIEGLAIDAAQTHAQCSGYTPKSCDYYSPVNAQIHKLDCTQGSQKHIKRWGKRGSKREGQKDVLYDAPYNYNFIHLIHLTIN